MKKILIIILFFSLTSTLFSCKKEDLDDQTVYEWKRELVSDLAINPLSNPSETPYYVVTTEYVFLTNAQMEEQKKAKRKDGTIFYYRFTKVS